MIKTRLDYRKAWVTADLHVGHGNIMKYCLRPQLPAEIRELVLAGRGRDVKVPKEAVDAHDRDVVDRINRVWTEDDVLVLNGDLTGGPPQYQAERLRWLRDALHPYDVLVAVGNHDDHKDLERVFGKSRVAERWHFEMDSPGGTREFVVDHYGGDSWLGSHKGVFQLFGHSHGGSNYRRRQNPGYLLSEDVGVDCHGMEPWDFAGELCPLFDARRAEWNAWRRMTYERDKEDGGMAAGGET